MEVPLLIQGVCNLLVPCFCPECGAAVKELNRISICDECWSGVRPMRPPYCLRCGRSVEGPEELVLDGCRRCEDEEHAADGIYVAARYEGPLRTAIRGWKFARRFEFTKEFARMMMERLERGSPSDFDAVVPVPLHWTRYLGRGYNQTALLAELISLNLGVPMVPGMLRKKWAPWPQSSLEDEERRRKGPAGRIAIAPFRKVEGLNILLVDDVITTGTTVNACVQALKSGGAREVRALVLARGR